MSVLHPNSKAKYSKLNQTSILSGKLLNLPELSSLDISQTLKSKIEKMVNDGQIDIGKLTRTEL